MTETDPVVVGVDGSDDATGAVRWAADFAERHGRPLVLVHAWIWPFFNVPLGPAPGAPDDGGLRNLAERTLREAMETAREQCPTLKVTGRLAITSPTVALRGHSEDAAAVVIGSHGKGKVSSFMLGSVGVDLAGHTRCPLVVVRGTVNDHGPVVLGVDDSPRTHEAIEFAFREASARGAALRAVHSWSLPVVMPDWPDGVAQLLSSEEKHARTALESLIEPMRERHPDVQVECLTPPGAAGRNLVEASVGAQLVVVGARGRGGFRGLVLGSTSHTLMHHAECPVVIAPHHVDLEDDDDELTEDDTVISA